MQYINDPELLNALNSGTPSGVSSFAEESVVEPQQDGSILDALSAKYKSIGDELLAGSVSPSFSNYANKRAIQSNKEFREEQSKLGMAGNLAVGIAGAAPAIALGIANPFAGAAAMSAMTAGDTLLEQRTNLGETDFAKAGLAGLGSGAVDLALGGAGNIARAALGARAGAKAGSALPIEAPLAQRAGLALAEDVPSNVASEAFMNMASGKDWDENLGEAALFGAAGGAAVRGSLAGLNRAAKFSLNDGGRASIQNVQNLSDKGLPPNQQFADEAVAYNNLYRQMDDNIANARTPEELETAVDASINMSATKGGMAADLTALRMADEYGLALTDGAFDINTTQGLARTGDTYNIGNNLGIDSQRMIDSARNVENVQATYFGRDKAASKELTKETDQKAFQETYKRVDGIMKGSYKNNISEVERLLREAKASPDSTHMEQRELGQLLTSLRNLERDMQSYTGNKKTDTSLDITNNAREALRMAHSLGIANKLQGVDGKPGSWDPINGIMAIDRLEQMARARMPSVHQGAPSVGKDQKGSGTGTAIDVAGLVTGNIWAPIARRGFKEAGAHLSQRRLAKEKEGGAARVKGLAGIPAGRRAQAGLDAGDLSMAAKGAEADLQDMGMTPPASEPAVVQTTPAPEAPVTPVEPVVTKSSPVPARAPKARQEAVQAAPEVEAKVVPTPQPQKMAKKPRTVKKAEKLDEDLATKEPVRAVEETEVTDVTPKKSRTLTPDKISPAEPKVEPAQEAPKKPVQSSEIRKSPKPQPKPAEAPEPVVEAPKAEEPKPEPKPKTSATELVTNPLKKKADELDGMSPAEKSAMPTEELRKLRRAKEDLEFVQSNADNLASQFKTSPETIMSYIHELGGMDGIRKSNADAGHKGSDSDLRKFIVNRIREFEDLKKSEVAGKLESLREKIAKKAEPIQGEKATETSRIANKHGLIRSRLESLGYPKEIMDEALKRGGATDTSLDFDPVTVSNWARRLDKERVSNLAEEQANAARIASEKAEKYKTAAQKGQLTKYLKKLKVEGDETVKGLINSAFRKAGSKPLTDVQMNNLVDGIDKHLEMQRQAYEAALAAPRGDTPIDTARAATYADQQRTVKRLNDEANAELAKAQKEMDDAVKAEQKLIEDYTKLFDQAEKRGNKFDNARKLDEQSREMTDSLLEMGAPEHFVQQAVHNAFIKRDTPLSDKELNKVRAKVVNELEKLTKSATATAKNEAKPVVKAMSDAELVTARSEIMDSASQTVSDPKNQAVIQSVTEELKSRGLNDEAKILDTYNRVVSNAEKMQQLHPNNKEWWITASDVDDIQRSFGKGEASSYAGPLLRRLREKFYGSSHETEKFYRNSPAKVQQEIKASNLTDSDVVVKGGEPVPVMAAEPPRPETLKPTVVPTPAPAPKAPVATSKPAPAQPKATPQPVPAKAPVAAPKASTEPKVRKSAVKKKAAPVEREPDTSNLTDAENAMIEAMTARITKSKENQAPAAPKTPLQKMGIGKALADKDLSDLTSRDFDKIESVVRNPDNGLDAKKAELILNRGSFDTVGEMFEELMKTQKKSPKGVLDSDVKVK